MGRLLFLGALFIAGWYIFVRNTGTGDPRGIWGHQVGKFTGYQFSQ